MIILFVKIQQFRKYFFFYFFPFVLFAQGTYYNGLDTGSVNFVTDLHNLINPHTRITYDTFDETNVANFASRDTTSGQKVVTCVYSGENYVYIPPFTWAVYSREHTWCQSWMPSAHASGFTSLPEYSDQHHLFPVNQNKANGIRSNHPEGNVVTPSYTYLSCKLGADANGHTVFEPRASHKGDAARALLYMAICYNGVSGFDWTFNNLNRVLIDSLGEPGGQDVNVLLQWHNQDPPDQWEKDRNEYVFSIQGNRNPFIDHPEYANVIDFNTLTKKTGGVTPPLADEPTYYPKGFSNFSPTLTDTSITVKWADTNGTVLASGYLLVGSAFSTISDPVDGVVYSDDTNLNDGLAKVNITYSAPDSFRFGGLSSATSYYFKIWPYNGNGSQRKYKTTNFPISLYMNFTTTGSAPSFPSIVVNEYFNGGTSVSEWYELLVLKDNLDLRNFKIRDYSNAGGFTQTPLTFANTIFWSSVKKGSFIVVYTSGTGQPTGDTDFSDKKVVLSATDATYFSGPTFTIAGGNDVVEIFDANGTHVHAMSHGSYPGGTYTSVAQPRVNAIGSSSSGDIVRMINVSSVNDFTDSTKIEHKIGSFATPGLPNDATETTFVTTVLPVELVSLSAVAHNSSVMLHWSTATELNNYGFEIERRPAISQLEWKKIGFVDGNGTTNAPKEYSFVDNNSSSGKFSYRLKQIDRDGKFEYSQEVEVTVGQLPKEFALTQNYPNPFNPTTTIQYSIPAGADGHPFQSVSLKIYDSIGREVATLVNEIKETGYYSVTFDASKLSSGIYFAKLQSGDQIQLKKMMLIK